MTPRRPALASGSWLVMALAGCAGVGPAAAPPSCPEAASVCGPAGESCCTSLEVPAGTYDRTYTNDGTGPVGAADPASVSAYRLDRYLVTVGRFRRFVAASIAGWVPLDGEGKHTHVNHGAGLASAGGAGFEPGWAEADTVQLASTATDWETRLACEPSFHTWTDEAGAHEQLPINCVSWYDAYAFCIWDGGFLPSEAEWELAAAGGDQQRAYPWGSTDPGTGEDHLISDCHYPLGANGCTGIANVAPVGTAVQGSSRWGQLDLAGDLGEWTLDWYAPYVTPCADCVFLTDYSYRVFRGGSFGTDVEDVFPWARDGDVPASRNAFHGFRCARSP